MSIDDLWDDIRQLEAEYDGNTPMCEALVEIASMYDEDREKCKVLQDAFNIEYPTSYIKVNVV